MGVFNADNAFFRKNQLGLQGQRHIFFEGHVLPGCQKGIFIQFDSDPVADKTHAIVIGSQKVFFIAQLPSVFQGHFVYFATDDARLRLFFDQFLHLEHGRMGRHQILGQVTD